MKAAKSFQSFQVDFATNKKTTSSKRKKVAAVDFNPALNENKFENLLIESDPSILQLYLQRCLSYLKAISGNQVILYLRDDVKASLEMALVNSMSVSSLKLQSSPLNNETLSSIVVVSSNLIACKGVKEQAESPLLSTML